MLFFQDFKLLPKSTVYENVAFALEVFGLPKSEIHSKVIKVLDLVGLKHKIKNYPRQLSGGEQQRVAIARALVNNPKIILADEPTGNLDSKSGDEVMKFFHHLNEKEGRTIVFVTHDMDLARQANRTIIIKDGKISEEKHA